MPGKDDPAYLVWETPWGLYLNMIDPQQPLFHVETFQQFLSTARGHEKLLIHCNEGNSRAPALAMLHLSKNAGVLPTDSYDAAKSAYKRLDPVFTPSSGIDQFLREHWQQI